MSKTGTDEQWEGETVKRQGTGNLCEQLGSHADSREREPRSAEASARDVPPTSDKLLGAPSFRCRAPPAMLLNSLTGSVEARNVTPFS